MTALILLSACSGGEQQVRENTPADAPLRKEVGEYRWWTLRDDGARLRESPGPEGRVIENLAGGTKVADLGELSSFLTSIQLSEERFDEPWWRVRAPSGKEGWIFGGVLADVDSATLLEKRTQALFSQNTVQRLTGYRKAYRQARTAKAVAACYREGLDLRDDLVAQIEEYFRQRSPQVLPDLFWLSEVLPAFLPQLIAEKTGYYLFADYRAWEDLARKSPEREDDHFFRLCIGAFPSDSIEFFYPVWTIFDGSLFHPGGHSLLGRDIHRRLLKTVDRTLDRSRLFRQEVLAMKNDLINDIIQPDVTYWEETDSIAGEIHRILSDSLSCLTGEDQLALQARLRQLQSDSIPIQTNYKNGATSPLQ